MGFCVNCGMPLPDDQYVCFMCYGDVEDSDDGYYRDLMEEQDQYD
jgi:hypothetical protein